MAQATKSPITNLASAKVLFASPSSKSFSSKSASLPPTTTEPRGLSIHFPLPPSPICALVSGKMSLKLSLEPTSTPASAGNSLIIVDVSWPNVQSDHW